MGVPVIYVYCHTRTARLRRVHHLLHLHVYGKHIDQNLHLILESLDTSRNNAQFEEWKEEFIWCCRE